MERICSKLELMGFDFNDKTALEFFARDGSWQAMPIIKRVGKVTLWEIDPSFYSTLSTIKNSEVVIGDSFQLISSLDQDVLFDFINIDTPQGIYTDNKCEHFEALACIKHLIRSVISFRVNRNPKLCISPVQSKTFFLLPSRCITFGQDF